MARCFRDEDLRADRQPEFTQLDMELAFTDADGIMGLMERLISRVFAELLGVQVRRVGCAATAAAACVGVLLLPVLCACLQRVPATPCG